MSTERTDWRMGRTKAAALALVVTALAAVGFLFLQARGETDTSTAHADAKASAVERLPRMLSYSFETLDRDLATAKEETTGDFHDDYAKILDEVVAAHATKARVVTRAEVRGAGVVSGDEDEVTVLVFLTQTTTDRRGTPAVSGSRVEVTMTRSGDTWKIAGLQPV